MYCRGLDASMVKDLQIRRRNVLYVLEWEMVSKTLEVWRGRGRDETHSTYMKVQRKGEAIP